MQRLGTTLWSQSCSPRADTLERVWYTRHAQYGAGDNGYSIQQWPSTGNHSGLCSIAVTSGIKMSSRGSHNKYV